jgi:2,3-bisphosphoglycerate-independent phosphoglycerate mutase
VIIFVTPKKSMNKKVILMILDGWGVTQDPNVSATANARTPYIDSLYEKYPHAQLLTHGLNVGLPSEQMGNSEVGHMNLGAGRIVYQDLVKVNLAIQNGSLKYDPVLKNAFLHARENNSKVHFMGLLSNGGVHSHIDHLKGFLSIAAEESVEKVYVHAFTDGRDVDPKSGIGFIAEILEHLQKTTGKLASVCGRYYAMDRDKRWARIKKAYDALVHGKGQRSNDIIDSIKRSYSAGITDEFIEPTVIVENGEPIATIEEDDVIIFFNFRTDRGRQLTRVLTQERFDEFDMEPLSLHYVTLTNYDDTFTGIHVIYNKEHVKETLGEILERYGRKQIRIAETEKYPHVTFFFSGGREVPFKGEKRIMCPSPKVATYDLKPEMSAYEVRDSIIPEIQSKEADFICLNFANGDMVGHTGVFKAAIKACEAVDTCTRSVIETAIENDYSVILLADHGNCETMMNPDGSPHTAHTMNPVPVILIDKDVRSINDGILGDISPTILQMMGIDKPESMNQNSLII